MGSSRSPPLPERQDDLPEVLSVRHGVEGGAGLGEGEDLVDHRGDAVGLDGQAHVLEHGARSDHHALQPRAGADHRAERQGFGGAAEDPDDGDVTHQGDRLEALAEHGAADAHDEIDAARPGGLARRRAPLGRRTVVDGVIRSELAGPLELLVGR